MKYRVTCLTPTLVGDGQRLAPIDYMVWKGQVNVLDQNRIFRLLSKGPRLESYLGQLKRAEKLDFASWGGFAQNFAGRRISFEDPSAAQYWERARAENLFIPTFATGPRGAYLPASALKGAIRTGTVAANTTPEQMHEAAARAAQEGRVPRQLAHSMEETALGSGAANPMRLLELADSQPVPESTFQIYLLRVSTLEPRGKALELAWKQAPRGTVRRPEESTPIFAEMAKPGAVFEGEWQENAFLSQPEIARAVRRKRSLDVPGILNSVNTYTEKLLGIHLEYAETAGLSILNSTLTQLRQQLDQVRERTAMCLLPLGWGGGFLSKTGFLDTSDNDYKQLLRQIPFYSRAIASGLPFPKTRKIVFLGNQPAALPGFVRLEIVQ